MRIGLIGTGNWARTVHGPSVAAHPNADLVGVWGRDRARAADVAGELGSVAYADLEGLLDEVDAVTFAVPPDVQPEIAMRAARLGRHLLLEKPIALTATDAVGLERAVADAHVASIVFFTRRFLPDVQAWLERVAEHGGWYGGRAEADFNYLIAGNQSVTSPWRREHGALWDLGPHSLAQLLPVLGQVTAVTAIRGRGDQVHLVMRHTGNRSSTASFSYTSPTVSGNSLYVDGTAGRLAAPMGDLSKAEFLAAHRAALDALIDQSQRHDASHPCDVHFGARVVEVLAAARQSLASGCQVEVVPP